MSRTRVELDAIVRGSRAYAADAGVSSGDVPQVDRAIVADEVDARLSNALPSSTTTSERASVFIAPARLSRERLYYPGQTYSPSDLAPREGRVETVVHTVAGKTLKNPMRGRLIDRELVAKAKFTDARFLTQFVSDTGKMYPKRKLGVSAKAQRAISRAIKTARQMGILPYNERLPQFRRARNPET